MKLGSLFDGSGGFPLAGTLCGIEPVWAAEVEPYPIAVTNSRFPKMRHLGSVTDIHGGKVEPVDIITFGSPCQDLSVAGKRAGLKHEENGDEETTRSGLFMEAVRIIKEMREATNGRYPTFALWENVPGAFSSNKGEDFRIVLEELIKIVEPRAVMPAVPKNGWAYADSYRGDGWSLSYRVFDAQYWGVPQRRRRIYLVLDLRGERARKVLFEREGVRGYFAEGRETRQAAAAYAEGSVGADDRGGNGVIAFAQNQREEVRDLNGVAVALNAEPGTHQQTFVAVPKLEECIKDVLPFDTTQVTSPQNGNNPKWGDPCHPLAAQGHPPTAIMSVADDREEHPITFEPGILRREGGHIYEGVAGTLRANAGDNQLSVAYSIENHPADSRVDIDESGKVQTLTSRMGTGGGNVLMVMEPIYCLQWSMIGRENRNSPQGDGVNEETSFTLNTIDRPAVAYGVETFHCTAEEEKVPTLKARDWKDPHVVAIDRAFFNQGQNAQYDPQYYTDGTVPTLVARGPSAVAVRYIVRRLTPTECARLQGFPDLWGHPDYKEDFTDEEYAFWTEVRCTHAIINGKEPKTYTREQMVKWYNGLHTDSAEYKMWGNGIALPCARYVMEGIAEVCA